MIVKFQLLWREDEILSLFNLFVEARGFEVKFLFLTLYAV